MGSAFQEVIALREQHVRTLPVPTCEADRWRHEFELLTLGRLKQGPEDDLEMFFEFVQPSLPLGCEAECLLKTILAYAENAEGIRKVRDEGPRLMRLRKWQRPSEVDQLSYIQGLQRDLRQQAPAFLGRKQRRASERYF